MSLLGTTRSRIALSALGLLLALMVVGPAAALLMALRPTPYPNAVFDGMRKPSFSLRRQNGCVQATLVNRWLYHSADAPQDILDWHAGQGWMINFGYHASVLRQLRQVASFVTLTTVRETYVYRPGPVTTIASSARNTVSIGQCS